jgi:hypothetical protein
MDYRHKDRLGRLEPRNPFGDAALIFTAFPQVLAAFDTDVPASHCRPDGVACVCGESVRLTPAKISKCKCGRYFIRAKDKTRCAKQ